MSTFNRLKPEIVEQTGDVEPVTAKKTRKRRGL